MHQVFGPHQPVAQYFQEACLAYVCRRIQILGKGAHGTLVYLEKQTVLAAEVLKD